MTFQQQIQEGIPSILPQPKPYDPAINHAPKRKEILSHDEKKLALRNALRYFEPQHHAELAKAYRNISFEREAYTNEANSNYLNNRALWSFIKFT